MLWPVLAVVSVACISTGRKIDVAYVEKIESCKTSEEDLLKWFGEPERRGNQSGFPTMGWSYSSVTVIGTGAEVQSLVVYLNPGKKVVEFQLNPTGALVELRDKCAQPPPAGPRSAGDGPGKLDG